MITNGAAPAGALAVVHDARGRLRLRLPPHTNTRGLRDTVAGIDGVTACEWSPRTRSLLVRYEAERTAPNTVLEAIGQQTGLAAARPRAATAGPPAFGTAVRDVFSDINGWVSRWTGGALDLPALVPLSLTVWALREIVRGQVAPLAWSTALWYAHGLFRDYSLPASPSPRPDE